MNGKHVSDEDANMGKSAHPVNVGDSSGTQVGEKNVQHNYFFELGRRTAYRWVIVIVICALTAIPAGTYFLIKGPSPAYSAAPSAVPTATPAPGTARAPATVPASAAGRASAAARASATIPAPTLPPASATAPAPAAPRASATVAAAGTASTSYSGDIVEQSIGPSQINPAWLVGSNGERYHILSANIWSCLRSKGHDDLGPESASVLGELPDSGQSASCSPAPVPAPATVQADYIGYIVEQYIGPGQINPAWLVGSNGERYHILNSAIWYCLQNEGHPDLGPQISSMLDDLPDSGQPASCP
jgi:hypothetical protein